MEMVYVVHPFDASVRMRINAVDYDPATMTLWKEQEDGEVQTEGQGQGQAVVAQPEAASKRKGRPRRG